jgi:predicted aconitase with swiveling domain
MADRSLVPGEAEGIALVLDEPLSFWGGIDPESGRIIDRRHPQNGQVVKGRVLVMPSGRGSSSSSSVLAEALRVGAGPAAIVLGEPDAIVVLGALVASELYGISCPVVVPDEATFRSISDGSRIAVGEAGVTTSRR